MEFALIPYEHLHLTRGWVDLKRAAIAAAAGTEDLALVAALAVGAHAHLGALPLVEPLALHGEIANVLLWDARGLQQLAPPLAQATGRL